MNPLGHAIDTLDDLTEELTEIAEDAGVARGDIHTAVGYLYRAVQLLAALPDLSPRLSAEVEALRALCVCGHDRGDHLVEAPHTCEGEAFPDEDGSPRWCGCTGYVLADRDTEAPASSPTDIDELEGVSEAPGGLAS